MATTPDFIIFAVTKPKKYKILWAKIAQIPVFGEYINLLDKRDINKIAVNLKTDRYAKRLDSYQHLVIMLYATLGQFNSLREVELGFLSSATRMNHFGLDYMVRRSTLSDANPQRNREFFAKVYYHLYDRYRSFLSDSRLVKGTQRPLYIMDFTTISLFGKVFRSVGRNPIYCCPGFSRIAI